MDDPSLVFALAYTCWDAPSESGVEAVMIPTLYAFADAALAASSNEGLSIVEGDLSFLAA
jgi:hypothetical protein